jgi:pullulanase
MNIDNELGCVTDKQREIEYILRRADQMRRSLGDLFSQDESFAAYEILTIKQAYFVLWRPRIVVPPPRLIIGTFQAGNPPTLANEQAVDLLPLGKQTDLWGIAATECDLTSDTVYHYWFEVTSVDPYTSDYRSIRCTDPMAWTVDWRLLSSGNGSLVPREIDRYPAGVVLFRHEQLEPCDPGGQQIDWDGDPSPDILQPNNRLVIYELPTAWSRINTVNNREIDVGTFRDVIALIERDAAPANFYGVAALEPGHAHIVDLGINALELLPPADSLQDREWGYSTSNYFAADFDLGFPDGFVSPTAMTDLVRLIKACHQHGMRFFDDVVMAFATRYSYRTINFSDFFVQANVGDPEEVVNGEKRNGFGGDLFKYNYRVDSYNPVDGGVTRLVPARALMYTYLKHWMNFYRISGIRMDDIKDIANWDFIGEFKDRAHQLWNRRWQDEHSVSGADARFLVVGEYLDYPACLNLLAQKRVDAVWNEQFKRILRYVILGQNEPSVPSFEKCVRRLIDCRELGFRDGTQVINYMTSHDVGGRGNERLYNFLNNHQVRNTEPRIKLAFVCLLTAVGIPMILAGEEFADQHDLPVDDTNKQVDPVNFDRMNDLWRKRIYDYVRRLVRLRSNHDALSTDDTTFIHVDLSQGKRVLVWLRGQMGTPNMVVVIANFSDYVTPNPFSGTSEYVVPNWPALPPGMHWHEVTQDRPVPDAWAGREPIFPWEAKVYEVQEAK